MTSDVQGEGATGAKAYCWTFGNAEFDEARWQLRVAGQDVELERKPLEVLQYLLRHAGEAVTKDELLAAAWAGRVVVEAVLTNAIGKLRRALADEAQDIVMTLPRVGYRLAVPVSRKAVEFVPDASRLDAGDTVPRRPNWKLETPLARTGGNEVWLARHTKTRETRVFKFSLAGKGLNSLKREVTIARLLREALGERDDFVHVLDWDFEEAPYFVESEYGGLSLDQWPASGGIAAVPMARRLALFVEVADAVGAAHGIGVLHKDLKPANLLVYGEGDEARMRVADFGSSRLFDSGRLDELGITHLGLTQTQAISPESGTPLYLAPEVVAGNSASIKSDVYALGVTLYQLLVGDFRRQLSPGWENDIDDPLLRQDIADAANGDPAKRLESAAAFAERIRTLDARREKRALEMAVQARVAEGEKRLAKVRARRPWMIAAIVALVAGLVISGSMWRKSEQQAQVAREQRDLAEKQARRAKAAVDFLSKEVFGAVSPNGAAYERDLSAKEMLQAASARIDDKFKDDPATRGSVYAAMGASWGALRSADKSKVYWQRAVESYALAFGADDEASLLAQYRLVKAIAETGKFDEAANVLNEADVLAGARLDGEDELAVQGAWARGYVSIQQQKVEEAMKSLKRADRLQRLVLPNDAVLATNIRGFLADAYLRVGRSREAEVLMKQTLAEPMATAESIGAANRGNMQLSLARSLRAQGKYSDALTVLHSAVAPTEQVLGSDARQTRVLYRAMAELYGRLGNCAKALEILNHQWNGGAGNPSETKRINLAVGNNLATWEYRCGNAQRGVELMRQVLTEQLSLETTPDTFTQIYRYRLAYMLAEQRMYDDALELTKGLEAKALAAGTGLQGWDERLSALQGIILIGKGDVSEGRLLVARALKELESFGTEYPAEISTLRRLLTP